MKSFFISILRFVKRQRYVQSEICTLVSLKRLFVWVLSTINFERNGGNKKIQKFIFLNLRFFNIYVVPKYKNFEKYFTVFLWTILIIHFMLSKDRISNNINIYLKKIKMPIK